MPLPQQQQQQQLPPQQQSHHAMQQQHQQQCGSQSSQHSSSGLPAQASTPQQHANHAGMITHGYSDRGEDTTSLPMSLAAQHEQHRGQTSASRAVPSTRAQEATIRQQGTGRAQQKELSKQQGSCMQQDAQGVLSREATVADAGMAVAQASSRPFLDGLRPCSPSERCSLKAAAHANQLLTGWLHLNNTFCFSAASLDLEVIEVVRGCTASYLCGLAYQDSMCKSVTSQLGIVACCHKILKHGYVAYVCTTQAKGCQAGKPHGSDSIVSCQHPCYVALCLCLCLCLCLLYTPNNDDLLYTAEQGTSGAKEQEVIDLQVNNEALLCMLERERQHSQRLAEALQQAEANSLEVSLSSV